SPNLRLQATMLSSGPVTCICGLRERGGSFPPHPLPARQYVIRTSVCERITATLCPSGDACLASCHRCKRAMTPQNPFPERGAALRCNLWGADHRRRSATGEVQGPLPFMGKLCHLTQQ